MTFLEVLALICALIGIIGSIIPGIPGPPVSWLGLLLCYISGSTHNGSEMTVTFLIIWLAITIIVTVLDYIVPMWTTRMTGGHKAASTGAIIGLFAGMLIPPVGMILGSLIGAFLGELMVTDQGAWAAFKAGIGAFLGFILGTGLKLISSGVMLYYIIVFAI